MKYSLDLYLVHRDQNKIQEVLSFLPSQFDSEVYDGDYTVSDIIFDGKVYRAHASIRFNNDVSRESIYQLVLNVNGVLSDFEVGTFIQKHICYHDTNPSYPCEVEIVYEVVK